MGIGDEIIATWQAKKLYESNPTPVRIVGIDGRQRWHIMWEYNPKITRIAAGHYQTLVNGPRARPYIKSFTDEKWEWQPFGIEPGEINLQRLELKQVEPHFHNKVIIVPSTKVRGSNKDWGFANWQKLADMHPGMFVQLGDGKSPLLHRVPFVRTSNFRIACAYLSRAVAFVSSEGAMHHAAAALGVPGVVIFGGFISPDITGYRLHDNIFTGGEACGMRIPCDHCKQAMRQITVAEVSARLLEVVKNRKQPSRILVASGTRG